MASTTDLINYYANLLILQYLGKPKAYATIQALVTPVIMDQLPLAVQDGFNLTGTTAQGTQLDVIGKYVGVSRTGAGINGPITLSDADYLLLIQLGIIRNSAQSSLSAIQALIHQFFNGDILVFDYANMHMSYLVSTALGSQNFIQVAVSQKLLPKPMGVTLAATIFAPIIDHFFGFRTYLAAATNSEPFNDYASYQTTWPWVTYADAISF